MKKIYIMPTTAVLTVELEAMIAASNSTLKFAEDDKTVTLDFAGGSTTDDDGANLSRGSFWDD